MRRGAAAFARLVGVTLRDLPASSRPADVADGRWWLLGAAAWLVAGLQLDAWAHATIPELETFWTPWHAVLYSGIAACGGVLAWLVHRQLPPRPTVGALLALPPALRVAVAGMALLLVGGGIDTLWHNLFGIEQELEIFVSPSHVLIILGMVLVAAGPALMRASLPDGGRPGVGDTVLVLASALLAGLPLQIFTLHANVLGWPHLGSGEHPMPVIGTDALAVHGYVTSTVLLLVPVLLTGRRWTLPVGIAPVLVGVPAATLWVIFGEGDGWYPVAVTLAAVLTEIVLRAGRRVVAGLPADGRWVALGTAAPVVLWGAVLAAGAVLTPAAYGWNVHTTTGILLITAVFGALTATVARRVR